MAIEGFRMTAIHRQTRRQRLEQREESIILAAHEEFVARGYHGARIADIARRAGVAEGTLYLYFRNKDALLWAALGRFYTGLTAGAESGVAERATTGARLAFLATHHLRRCLAEWSVLSLAMSVLYQTNRYRDSEFITFNRTYVAVFDQVLREGIARGDVRDDLPLHLMRDLFYGALEHTVRTVMVRERQPVDEASIDRLAADVMSMVGPAFGLERDRRPEASDKRLESVAGQLEAAVNRLEKVLSPTRLDEPGASEPGR